jgi:hypothetical protein
MMQCLKTGTSPAIFSKKRLHEVDSQNGFGMTIFWKLWFHLHNLFDELS